MNNSAEILPQDSNQDLFVFEPSAKRARIVESKVRSGLADSLSAVLSALSSCGARFSDELVLRIYREPISPAVFALYTDLVEAIFADETGNALELAEALCAPGFGAHLGLRIASLEDDDLGLSQAARYNRLINDDPQSPSELRPLPPAVFASEVERVERAIALLEIASPELAGELRALVREIVLVQRPGGTAFGASSFQLWGALFLNPCPLKNRVALAEALVHEAAHTLLFGLGMGQALVENDVDERYRSPIRQDPRPMDGVVHATYVLARMYYLTTVLLESGLLTRGEEKACSGQQELHMVHYRRGLAEIEAHAKWTSAGEAAFSSAKCYMAQSMRERRLTAV